MWWTSSIGCHKQLERGDYMPANNFKVGEMLNKRTPNSKTWMNFDGSFTTEIHSGIVHYQDENGNLQNINTDLYDEADFDQIDFPVAKDGDFLFYEAQARAVSDKKKNRLDREKFDFQGLKVPFDCKIPRNIKRGYSIGKGRSKLSFIPVSASSSKGYVEGNKITYPDVWPDTDVVLEMLETGIKETIILKTNKAPFDFSFEVQGSLEGEMKIEPPWLQDAEGTKRDVVQGVSDEEGKIHLNLAADVSGLVYPIEIDPTVTITSNTTTNLTNRISSGSPNASYPTSAALYVGGDTGSIYHRSLMKFDISSIPYGSYISDARLNAYFGAELNVLDVTIRAFKVTSIWDSTVSWNTKPSYDPTALGATTVAEYPPNWINWIVTNGVQSWVNGETPNNGLFLIMDSAEEKVSYSRKTFDSAYASNRPYLSVSYNVPPTAPVVTVPNGGETWNSLHTVEWQGAGDADNFNETSRIQNLSTNRNLTFQSTFYHWAQVFTIADTNMLHEIVMGVEFHSGGNPTKLMLTDVGADGLPDLNTIYAQGTPVVPIGQTREVSLSLAGKNLSFSIGKKLAIVYEGVYFYGIGSTTNVYTGGEAYYKTTGSTIWLNNFDARFKVIHANYPLQYQIQLTTNNGGSWKDVVSLSSQGETSFPYDFINEPETSLAKIRIRAYDGTSYGPWDESDGVFTIKHNQAPTTPTNLSPSNGARDRASVNRLSWQHNDANADPQAKFDLQWRVQGSSIWNDVTQSTVNQYYDAPANLFPRGTIEWRVRTYDQADLSSPYSAIATFFAGDKPAAPTIVLPGNSVAVANPTVQWSSTDQTGFLLTVNDATGTTVFFKERNSTNKAETITYSLENQQNYTIELKIKNADGLYSDAAVLNISVSYTPPAIPDIETVKGDSFVQIKITDPIPTGTLPAVLYHEIYKEIENEFVIIASGIQNEYKDYNVASGENTRYFVRTQGDNETFSDTITFSEIINFTGVWLHVVEEPESSIHQFKFDGEGRSSKWGLESAIHHFQGRKRPVIETGEMEEYTVDFSLIIKSDTERLALENIVYSQDTVCYRDGRGRKAFGVFVEVPMNDETWRGYTTSLSLTKIDFKEGIE